MDAERAISVQEVFKGTSGPELIGDTLVTMGRARMCFIKLPSKAKRLPAKNWTVDLAFDGWSVAMHPPTNVVAVSEYTGDISYVGFKRSHDTYEPSPQKCPNSYSTDGHGATAPPRLHPGLAARRPAKLHGGLSSVHIHQSEHCGDFVPRIRTSRTGD